MGMKRLEAFSDGDIAIIIGALEKALHRAASERRARR